MVGVRWDDVAGNATLEVKVEVVFDEPSSALPPQIIVSITATTTTTTTTTPTSYQKQDKLYGNKQLTKTESIAEAKSIFHMVGSYRFGSRLNRCRGENRGPSTRVASSGVGEAVFR